MALFDSKASYEFKLQCLKWKPENEDAKEIREQLLEEDIILSDPNVRAILPELLCLAYSEEKIQVVLLLLDVLEDDVIQVKDDPRSWFQKIFCSAVEAKHTSLVRRMVQLGANVNMCSYGKPVLHAAACKGYEDIMTELVDEGADVHAVDNKGEHILHNLLKSQLNKVSKLSVTRLLLSYGVDPLVKSMSGKFALHIAGNESSEVLELFLQDGQDVNMTESVNNDTPLHVACGMCCQATIIKLLQYGALMNLENKHGETPLAKLLKHTYKSNDFHSKCRVKLAKLLIPIGFRVTEKMPYSKAGVRHKGRDKIYDKYKEIKVLCNTVPSLQNLSRIAVRESMVSGVNVPKLVKQLDIPSHLKGYLLCQELPSNHV